MLTAPNSMWRKKAADPPKKVILLATLAVGRAKLPEPGVAVGPGNGKSGTTRFLVDAIIGCLTDRLSHGSLDKSDHSAATVGKELLEAVTSKQFR